MKSLNILPVLGLCFLLAVSLTGCENDDVLSLDDFEWGTSSGGTGVEYIVEPDDGINSVNSLKKAIDANGPGTYILMRNGHYYCEGQVTISSNVVIKAQEGEGQPPVIQPICDAQGGLPDQVLRLECDTIRFENVYFLGKDAATGNLLQRWFRVQNTIRMEMDHCIMETSTGMAIRCESEGNRIFIKNSVLRNISRPTSASNGRLIDARKHDQDSIVIHNNYLYNFTGMIYRQDNAVTNYFELSQNTIWNAANVQNLDCPYKAVIENNIFANFGWKPAELPESGTDPVQWSFDLSAFKGSENLLPDIKVTVRNNNFFFSKELEDLYKEYEGRVFRRTLGSTNAGTVSLGSYVLREEQFVFENNITEELDFVYAPPLPLAYMRDWMDDPDGAGNSSTASFDTDEDGIVGIVNGNMYDFTYTSGASLTASTTGGKLGAVIDPVF